MSGYYPCCPHCADLTDCGKPHEEPCHRPDVETASRQCQGLQVIETIEEAVERMRKP